MKLAIKQCGDDNLKDRSGNPDVILIHGTGSSADMWLSQVEVLNGLGHRCFLPDLRGHGDSPELYEKTSLEVHVEDLLETLAGLPVTYPAVFVGHSLGALISLVLASKRPELASLLFLAALPARVPKLVPGAFRLFLNGPFQSMQNSSWQDKLPWRQKLLFKTDHHSLSEIVDNFGAYDLLSERPTVSCPVHLAAGRFDPVAPCVYIEKVHKSMPESTLKVFELGGHNFMDYHKQAFNHWIIDYMRLHSNEAFQPVDKTV